MLLIASSTSRVLLSKSSLKYKSTREGGSAPTSLLGASPLRVSVKSYASERDEYFSNTGQIRLKEYHGAGFRVFVERIREYQVSLCSPKGKALPRVSARYRWRRPAV